MERADVEITVEELKSRMDAGNPPILVDVRRPSEFEINRLPGAVLHPLDRIGEMVDEFEPGAEIVVYCHHGVRSLNAALFLRQHGFTGVRSLAGGIDLWSDRIDPAVPKY